MFVGFVRSRFSLGSEAATSRAAETNPMRMLDPILSKRATLSTREILWFGSYWTRSVFIKLGDAISSQ